MATITYPLLTPVDDSGAVLTGATVTIASVTDPDGVAIPSHGAALRTAALVSVSYDAEAKGEAVITLAISKAGSTVTGLNAAPAFYLSRDPSRIDSGISPAGQVALSAAGLDAVPVEIGVNARQALSPILAASAGVISGQDSNAPVIKAGGNPSVTRIAATTDDSGNRTSVNLTLPT